MKLKFGFLLLAMTACTFTYAQSAKSTVQKPQTSYEILKAGYSEKMRKLNEKRKHELTAVRANASLSKAQSHAQQDAIQKRHIAQKKAYELEVINAKKSS